MGLTSCRSTKNVMDTDTHTATSGLNAARYIQKVVGNNSTQQHLTAKVKVEVVVEGKSVSTSGSLKMKKNDVIQLSLVDPLLGMVELGRMEFTRTRVLIIDRVNKQYVEVPYSDVSFLKRANIDFNTLQALFWHEVFEPGKSVLTADNFNMTDKGNQVDLTYVDQMLTYNFQTQRKQAMLTRTDINNPSDASYSFSFHYNEFTSFEGQQFPKNMTMSFTADSQTTSLSLSLSSIKNSSDWIARTSAPAKYKEANPEKLFQMLVK